MSPKGKIELFPWEEEKEAFVNINEDVGRDVLLTVMTPWPGLGYSLLLRPAPPLL